MASQTEQQLQQEQQQQQQQQQVQQQQQQQQQHDPKRRAVCKRCMRPQRVCLCSALPEEPIQLAGTVVILQHPFETKKALATVPLLGHVLQPASLLRLVGRRLRAGSFPGFDVLLGQAQQAGAPVMVLWPGPGARCITDVQLPQLNRQPCTQCSQQQQPQEHQPHATMQQTCSQDAQHLQQQEQQLEPCNGVHAAGAGSAYVLVVVDGTWQQAKEMFSVLQPWLLGPGACAVQVQLPLTHAQGSSTAAAGSTAAQHLQHLPSSEQQPEVLQEQQSTGSLISTQAADVAAGVASLSLQPDPTCRLRTEPHEGCTTTYEAIVQAVSHLEAQCWQQQQEQQQQPPQQQQQQFGDGQAVHEQQQQQQQANLLARLLRPLQLMTQLQASFDPAVRARSQQGGSCVAPTRARLGLGGVALM